VAIKKTSGLEREALKRDGDGGGDGVPRKFLLKTEKFAVID
jgi:hypothetical protein